MLLYRFSGNLYFANIDVFINDIEKAVTAGTRCVVVDSGAICSIDITAADRIVSLNNTLKKNDIKLYFASHIGTLNDRFRKLGLGELVEEGRCRMTIAGALSDAGYSAPYDTEEAPVQSVSSPEDRFGIHEYEWAFGTNDKKNKTK